MVGLPNFLSRITLRPDGPRVALTAFASFSTPRRRACRAASSNCNCFAVIIFTNVFDFLTVVVEFAGTESNDSAFLRLLFRRIRNNDTTLFDFLLLERLNQ